jgi:hypothetical protein
MIERTTDWEVVKRELESRIDSIGCGMTAEHVGAFQPLVSDGRNWFVLAWEPKRGPGGEELVERLNGVFVFLDKGHGVFEVHTCTDRKNWGWHWVKLSKDVRDWFFERVPSATEVQTFVRKGEGSELRCGYVHLCGMRKCGDDGAHLLFHCVRKD